MPDEINDFLNGSNAKAFPFDNVGDTVSGVIIEMKKTQQTDMESGKPVYWDNGDPKMMLRITLQTDLQDDDEDEGVRSVYLRGGNYTAASGKGTSSLVAVKDAVRRSGSADGIQPGGKLTLQYSGNAAKTNRAYNAAKLYTAAYEAPSFAVDLNEMA
jgi:diaminopimelate epimerase